MATQEISSKPMDEGPMPKSASFIYRIIERKGRITPKDLIIESGMTPRTVRFALTYLRNSNLVKRVPCLTDMRQSYYCRSG